MLETNDSILVIVNCNIYQNMVYFIAMVQDTGSLVLLLSYFSAQEGTSVDFYTSNVNKISFC